jgi:hypothetical protein
MKNQALAALLTLPGVEGKGGVAAGKQDKIRPT